MSVLVNRTLIPFEAGLNHDFTSLVDEPALFTHLDRCEPVDKYRTGIKLRLDHHLALFVHVTDLALDHYRRESFGKDGWRMELLVDYRLPGFIY